MYTSDVHFYMGKKSHTLINLPESVNICSSKSLFSDFRHFLNKNGGEHLMYVYACEILMLITQSSQHNIPISRLKVLFLLLWLYYYTRGKGGT